MSELSRVLTYYRVGTESILQLTLADGKTVTHAGVLEFVADEGTVGLPPKVRRSLGKMGDESLGLIKVRGCRLSGALEATNRECMMPGSERSLLPEYPQGLMQSMLCLDIVSIRSSTCGWKRGRTSRWCRATLAYHRSATLPALIVLPPDVLNLYCDSLPSTCCRCHCSRRCWSGT